MFITTLKFRKTHWFRPNKRQPGPSVRLASTTCGWSVNLRYPTAFTILNAILAGPRHLALRIVSWPSKLRDSFFGMAFLSAEGEGTTRVRFRTKRRKPARARSAGALSPVRFQIRTRPIAGILAILARMQNPVLCNPARGESVLAQGQQLHCGFQSRINWVCGCGL
jgi:hypothetical protein